MKDKENKAYFSYPKETKESGDPKEIVDILKNAREKGQTVFTCGNGGSAATAEHFSNDLFTRNIKAVCLNSNTSIMTMIGNDFGYEKTFSKQLEIYANVFPEPDILIVFSVSGNSKNILEALKFPCTKIGFLGKGGKASEMVHYDITIDSKAFGLVESEHSRITHDIAEQLNL